MDFPSIRRGVGLWHTAWVFLGSLSLSGQVVINEVHYHPGDSVDQTEFIELYNAGVGSVDLGRWFLSQAVFYEIPRGTELAAGAYLVIAANPDRLETLPGGRAVLVMNAHCFRQLYPDQSIPVLGEFQGSLSNNRGVLELLDTWSGQSWQMAYKDNWYPETDGAGHSLVLSNPAASSSIASTKAGWRSSAWTYGSPGKAADQTDRDGDGLPDAWELFYGLDPSSDTDASLDEDEDGLSALQEYQAGTDPNDPASRVRLRVNLRNRTLEIICDIAAVQSGQGYAGTRRYSLERRGGVAGQWEPARSAFVATDTSLHFGAPVLDGVSPVFYRLKVWLEPDLN